MSKKWVQEQLLTRIERLEDRVNVLEFLKEHEANGVALVSYLDLNDKDNEVSWYAKFLNYDKNKVVEAYLFSHDFNDIKNYKLQVVKHGDLPYRFVEVREQGQLCQVFKIDYFIERAIAQDKCLYSKAYNVMEVEDEYQGEEAKPNDD